jgi:hypothetical protein
MKHIFNHGLRRLTRMEEPQQGCAWQAKLALRFQIPSQASLHGIPKSQRTPAARAALLLQEAHRAFEDRSWEIEDREASGQRWSSAKQMEEDD